MVEKSVEERIAIIERSCKFFLMGINFIDSSGNGRSLGFRSDIQEMIDSADNNGHFKSLDAEGNLMEEGDIKEIFYTDSPSLRHHNQVSIDWNVYLANGKPEFLESKTSYYIPAI